MPTQTETGPMMRQVMGETFAPISVSTLGDNTVVAAVPNQQIRVVAYHFLVAGPVVATWKSNGAGAISGPMRFDSAGKGISVPWTPRGIFQTAVGEPLVLNLDGNVSVGGALTYILVGDLPA